MSEDYFYIKDGFLEPEFCNSLIDKYRWSSLKTRGRLEDGTGTFNENIKKNTCITIHQHTPVEWIEIWSIINDKIADVAKEYHKTLLDRNVGRDGRINDVFSTVWRGSFKIEQYGKGDFYRWHHDMMDVNNRIFKYIIYLNDMEDDAGGTTDFYNGKSIKPEQGKLIVFPVSWTSLYREKKVEKGYKYVITGFTYGNNPTDAENI